MHQQKCQQRHLPRPTGTQWPLTIGELNRTENRVLDHVSTERPLLQRDDYTRHTPGHDVEREQVKDETREVVIDETATAGRADYAGNRREARAGSARRSGRATMPSCTTRHQS